MSVHLGFIIFRFCIGVLNITCYFLLKKNSNLLKCCDTSTPETIKCSRDVELLTFIGLKFITKQVVATCSGVVIEVLLNISAIQDCIIKTADVKFLLTTF